MSLPKRLLVTVASLALIGWASPPLPGEDRSLALHDAAERFAEAERKIPPQGDYWNAREQLALQALRVADKAPASRDAERILHWILSSPRSSPGAMQAARRLSEHHSTSKATTEWLLHQHPREWTPDLYERVLKAELPPESRTIVMLGQALHDRELLNLSDELKASIGQSTDLEARLGKLLIEDLRRRDGDQFAAQLVGSFERLADQHGERVIGGATIRELAEGATFAIRHLRLGASAAGLVGTSLDGNLVDLNHHRGHVVLVDFWATWCAPCVGELPKLREIKSKLDGDKFEILGVCVDDDREAAKKFVGEQSIRWPTIIDADGKLQRRWMALTLPTYYVLDQNHIVRYRGSNLGQAIRSVEAMLGKDEVADLVRLTMETFDKNRDRRLEKSELPTDKEQIIDAADSDRDGFLSIQELTSYFKANMTTTTTVPRERDVRD